MDKKKRARLTARPLTAEEKAAEMQRNADALKAEADAKGITFTNPSAVASPPQRRGDMETQRRGAVEPRRHRDTAPQRRDAVETSTKRGGMRTKGGDVKVSIYLDPARVAALKHQAIEEGITLSALLRRMLTP